MKLGHALVRRPATTLADGLVTHIDRVPVDVDVAAGQWAAYVDTLAVYFEIVEVDPADDLPDSVFVEDTMVVYDDLAVITRPGAPSRRPETTDAVTAAESIGLTTVQLTEPATLDGGDVLKCGTTMYVGIGGRTNAAGVDQLEQALRPLGVTVVAVPVTKALHLKSEVTALPDGTVIGNPPLVTDPSAFPSFLDMPEPSGAHVVVLGHDTVLMAADAPRSADLLRRRGMTVVMVDISEFEKLEGCVTCLSVRVRRPLPA
jgi:dimethylargininase